MEVLKAMFDTIFASAPMMFAIIAALGAFLAWGIYRIVGIVNN